MMGRPLWDHCGGLPEKAAVHCLLDILEKQLGVI